ncbi:MAG: hypothetical protein LBK82_09085 [Planctomycetaceae bacterium]|nr:hypothetical protein [Planctomycetaceae bacterium]
MLPSVLESVTTQPARPFSERIAHPFSPIVNQINCGKLYCLPFWNQ